METQLMHQIKYIRNILWDSFKHANNRKMEPGKLKQSEKDYVRTFFENYNKAKKLPKIKKVVYENHKKYFGTKKLIVKPSLKNMDIFKSFVEAQLHWIAIEPEIYSYYKLVILSNDEILDSLLQYIEDDTHFSDDNILIDCAVIKISESIEKVERMFFDKSIQILIGCGKDTVIPETWWESLKIANCLRRSKVLSINSGEYFDITDNEYFNELLEDTPAALLSRITT